MKIRQIIYGTTCGSALTDRSGQMPRAPNLRPVSCLPRLARQILVKELKRLQHAVSPGVVMI
ncbi:MAG: hypothetical protein OEW00_03390, partial [candidate division Zixibacteria bacterium]|nr:hypothetical protein [candidate division Zixibacteria bacterium]